MSVPLSFGVEYELLLKPKPDAMEILEAHGYRETVSFASHDEAAKDHNRLAVRRSIVEIPRRSRHSSGHRVGGVPDLGGRR